MHAVRTLGHGTLAAGAFFDLIRGAGIEIILDVRRFPGSRRHPQFARDEMATWLPGHGVEYGWLPSLGGRRKPSPESPNTALRNRQFRAYADHMASEEFAGGVAEVFALATARPVAIMCAESLWWRCHRRLLADHLTLVGEVPVEHLFHDGRLVAHDPTPGARRLGDCVAYDADGG